MLCEQTDEYKDKVIYMTSQSGGYINVIYYFIYIDSCHNLFIFQNVSAEQADLKVKMERVTEERDKAQKKVEQSGYFMAQHREVGINDFIISVNYNISNLDCKFQYYF